MPKLHISKTLSLPVDAVTQRISILGRTRSGKSHTAGVIVEEVLKARQQVVILDPKGDWHGLRSSADGKSAGLSITIMGGKHGDIPLEPTAGAIIADVVVEGTSLVLDLSLFDSKADEVRFATAFLDRLYRKNTEPILLVVDEADVFAPQKPEKNETTMLNRMETICRRGAGRGIGVVLISQRSAALHKGCLSQTELMIAHQTTAPQDKDAIKEWVVDHGDEEQRENFLTRIPKLKTGTAITWSPSWLEIYEEVTMRRKETYDSGDAPKVGQRRRAPKVLAQVDLERLKKHMSETIEKAKQEDPKLLRVEIQRLKAELAKKPAAAPALKSVPAFAQDPIVKDRIVEVPALKPGEIRKIRKLVESIEKSRSGLGSSSKSLETAATALSQALGKSMDAVERAKQRPQGANTCPAFVPVAQRIQPVKHVAAQTKIQKTADGDLNLLAGERKMLVVLAQFHPGVRTKSQLGSLSGYTPSGGTFSTYLSTLRKNNLIKEDHSGALSITDAGLDWFGGERPEAPTSTKELLEMWRSKLLAGERKMLDVLINNRPEPISKEELGDQSGYIATGGTFSTYLSTLRKNGLATVEGNVVRVSEALFELQSA